jgi:site-specific DNA-methyltransferase (adenine-specific)
MSERVEIVNGDSLLVLQLLDDNSVDAIVTDPPYGLAFMGKKWDYDVPSEELWRQCFRVLKAGGHLLCFAGTRTQHRMAVRIEDAGFEIRDMIAWVYGSGFPKSLDVSKAIDKAAGAERKVVGTKKHHAGNIHNARYGQATATEYIYSDPATPEAKQWEGWGTALKPALEPITVARKPLIGTVAENVMEWGTGGLNIDGCRVGTSGARFNGRNVDSDIYGKYGTSKPKEVYDYGRWPANLIHDGSEEVVGLFPDTKSGKMGPWNNRTTNGSPNGIYGKFDEEHPLSETYGDSGSAARFFYCAKASKRDRDEGNNHPTVKPTDLMRYLCRLVTPPDGTVLDPFMGSGSTGKAAVLEGFRFIGIEREEEYCEIAKARIKHAQQ